MTTYTHLFVALLALAACAHQTVYYNPNVSDIRMQNDLLDCEVRALKDAPVAISTETSPGHWVPKDDDREGYWVPGSTYSVDLNAALRKDLTNRCMALRGYQAIELPQCTDVDVTTVSTEYGRRMAPLTPDSCAVRVGESGWRIVNSPGSLN